jgi:hypothetical protein
MLSAMKSICRPSLMVLACAGFLSIAHAAERPGDASNAQELRRRAVAAASIHKDFLAMTEAAPPKERFDLYRTYGESVGAWVQIGFLRGLLDDAIAATSWSVELKLRMDLRDHARFTMWEIDQSIAHLDARIAEGGRTRHLRLVRAMRSSLVSVRATVNHLAAHP